MLKYFKLNIAVIGKSNSINPAESSGRWLKARMVSVLGKCVRERTWF